jgi:thioredoxin reductase (NADPH)
MEVVVPSEMKRMDDDQAHRLFPKLAPAQIDRLRRVGAHRSIAKGDVLVEVGMSSPPLFVVEHGAIEVVRVFAGGEELVTLIGQGRFTGETNLLSGQESLFRLRAAADGVVIELDRDALHRIVTTDTELSELLMRAFILRRVALIARGQGSAVILGSQHSADTFHLREFLSRNNQPYTYLDVERDATVAPLLERFHVQVSDVPLVIVRGQVLLRSPSIEQLARELGLNPAMNPESVHDVVVVGSGPAGLAAAVYAASEGLDVVVLEASAPGGQAGSSSKIENYLGFPTGVSGEALAGRAYTQAQKFGAQIHIAKRVVRLSCERTPYGVVLADGSAVRGRSIVIATGVQYRKLPLADLHRFEGVGVYYGATHMEAQLCSGCEVIVVGGGNSAGQAAVYLASTLPHVHMLVRGSGLAETMSRYLIARIEQTPNITLRTHTQIEAIEGEAEIERVVVRDAQRGQSLVMPVHHVFLMTGADPNTAWLDGCVALDDKGFVKTGAELEPRDIADWTAARRPHLLETNVRGVFAVGDVRSGSVKRVASAVGEGSICVQLLHQLLAEH